MTSFPSSFRIRILLLILVAAIPLLGVIGYATITQRHQHALENAERDVNGYTRLVAHQYNLIITSARQYLKGISELPQRRLLSSQKNCHETLVEVHSPFSYYRSIGLALPNGDIFCNSTFPVTGKRNIADRGYFQRALKTRDFGIGEYQIGRVTGKPTFNFGQVVFDGNEKPIALVYAALDIDWLNDLIVAAKLPADLNVMVIDREGTVVASYPESQQWVGKPIKESEIFQAIKKNEEKKGAADEEGTSLVGPEELKGPDGVSRLYTFTALEGGLSGSMYVAASIPKQAIYAAVNRQFIQGSMILVFIIAVTLLLAWFGADIFLLRPVRHISHELEKAAANDTPIQGLEWLSFGVFKILQNNYQAAIERARTVNAAIGLLMEINRISNAEATKKLKSLAMNSRRPTHEIAMEIIKAREMDYELHDGGDKGPEDNDKGGSTKKK